MLRKGAWTAEEDVLLKNHIQKFGKGKWHLVPLKAGLNRCRKSCRLRWLNYLSPDIKRGDFEEDEVDLMLRLHKLLGNRWALIAGRIPGRTANDVKNYWNTHIRPRTKRQKEEHKDDGSQHAIVSVIKPQPRNLCKTLNMYSQIGPHDTGKITPSNDGFRNTFNISPGLVSSPIVSDDQIKEYFNELFEDRETERSVDVGEGLHVVAQEDGRNGLFYFPIDDAMLDLLDSEQF
ncbi:hypothetical protein L1987_05637 [Smallanthus sonchifolius]|uniref:Uncharacterized protein n=1 Tax=Smallanthus sonchifolius TaxID=185202 RepID=A0ACB9JVW1_9ASTR|nr:hypothetical protein L1987_05637 [Smallanthus sonchifolius]